MISKFNLKIKNYNIPKYIKPNKYNLDNKSKNFIKNNLNNPIDNFFYIKNI